MSRLYLFAKGQTEQTFADTVLKPHLAARGVFLHKPVLIAHARKKGKVHRGGGRNYEPMRNDIVRFLKQEPSADVHFTTMIDLYALHADFPGRDEAEKLRAFPQHRVHALESAWANEIGDRRFIPFLQLHEFETYLFADVRQFELVYPDGATQIANLQAVAQSVTSPELIDDGPQTAPSKRIIHEFPDYAAAKPSVGPLVAELIGLARIRETCPHFQEWLTRLEQLSTTMGLLPR